MHRVREVEDVVVSVAVWILDVVREPIAEVDPIAPKQDDALLAVCSLAKFDLEPARQLVFLGEVVVEQAGVNPRLTPRPPTLDLSRVRSGCFTEVHVRLTRDRDEDCPRAPKERLHIGRAGGPIPTDRRENFADDCAEIEEER
jgi:hypothetical protein